MPAFNNNGRIIHYDYRRRGAQTLVMANSLGTNFRIFDALVEKLDPDLSVLRYDKRGHGLSDPSDAGFTIQDLASDLAALMRHLGVADAHLLGLSIGGLIIQSLAADHEDLVKSLILMDTGHKVGTPAMWNGRIAEIEANGIEGIKDSIMERWFTEDFRTNRRDELAVWTNMLTRTPKEGYIACARAIRDADFTESTRKLKLPVLCIGGDQDGATPPELVQELASLIGGAQFVLIENAGHIPCVEQTDVTAASINRFLEQQR